MTVSHGRRVAILALVVALVAVPTASAAVTAQQSTQNEIDTCTTIDQAGEYTLTSDVGANASGEACLTIAAGDVTLDGNGHSVDNAGGADTGILVQRGQQNVAIGDVTVTGWTNGIDLVDAYGASVDGVTVSGNQRGITFGQTVEATVSDSTATGNDYGILVEESQVTLSSVDVTENANGIGGLYADIVLEQSTVSNNDGDGIVTDSSSLTVDRSAVENNGNNGISVSMPESTTIQYTIIAGNGNGVSAERGQVDARENWWGADSGPSGNVEDPATGRLADGSGDSVSEGSESGVSNVRFDPYYVTDPRTGDGQLVGDEPTTDEPTTEQPTSEPTTDEPTTTAPTTAAPTDDGSSGDGSGDGDAGAGDGDAGAGDGGDAGGSDGTESTEQSTIDQSPDSNEADATTSAATGGDTTDSTAGSESATTDDTATGEGGANTTSAPAAGPGAPANETGTTAAGENATRTAQVIGGEGNDTSDGSGPGFGVLAALVALGATALLARRD
ncbi:right-handed parallel beta-helix repeat-containing protein [Halomarina salina]|uniref:Right-handed parallel beta-helix repeat-containing protein n=1 Tax=Halomarina salina TaxID=1872699 RepID=A0ABD5RPA8_9EURY|nr:right-handed parallel beta-helix repeat-containing protein [Halomarina salina]